LWLDGKETPPERRSFHEHCLWSAIVGRKDPIHRYWEDLTTEERCLFLEILFAREEALAGDFSEIGCVKPEVTSPVKIRTVPCEAWQIKDFLVPNKAFRENSDQHVEGKSGSVTCHSNLCIKRAIT